jgi:hypothetical protein
MYIHNGCITIDTVQYMSNLIKIRSTHLLPIFYRCVFFGRSCSRSNNPPLAVVSGVSMNTLSQIYISQSEIKSTLQNKQSENAFYVSSVLCKKKTRLPPCDMIDSASTYILPLFGMDELKQ